jgi:hypothetical protein
MTADEFMRIIDFNSTTSWAEYEFKAAVFGMQAGRDFCRWTLALTKLWSPVTPVVAEGILSSTAWDCFKSDVGLVADICELFNAVKHSSARSMPPGDIWRMADELSIAAACVRIADPPFDSGEYLPYQTRKYTLLDAVERRFPLLPVKYYAANARAVHASDEDLAVWIRRRLAERAETSDAFRKIYESMAAEFVDNHLAVAVFMK